MKYRVEQTVSGVSLGVYEADDEEGAIRAMLADGGDPGAETDPGLVAVPIREYCTQNDGDCPSCSLSSYGRDCRNARY